MVAPRFSILDNPYVVAQPLRRGQLTGRDDVLQFVKQVFSQRQQQAILLHGQRRIGKTSILISLRESLNPAEYVAVYFDFQDSAGRQFGETLYNLAYEINKASFKLRSAEFRNRFSEGFKGEESEPEKFFEEEFLPGVWQELGERRLVLLLDEVDTLNLLSQKQPAKEGTTALLIFQYLRHLLREEPRLLLVAVIGRPPQSLPEIARAAFLNAAHRQVTYLERGFAEGVVKIASERGLLEFTPESVSAILDLTSGHPYFTQLICSEVYNRSYKLASPSNGSLPLVTAQTVEESLPAVFASGGQIFEYIWNSFDPREKLIAALVAHHTDKPGMNLTREQILEELNRQKVPLALAAATDVPERLVENGIFQNDPAQPGRNYGFRVELMRRWIKAEKPLSKVRQELDKLDPVANSLYERAQGAENEENYTQALEDYRAALKLNPEHLGARMSLGQLLFRQAVSTQPPDLDMLKEAVTTLQETHQRNPILVRGDLVQALRLLAEHVDDEQAYRYYSEILAIQPGEMSVVNQIEHLAEKLVARNDLKKAQEYYQKAGNTIRAQELEREINRRNKVAGLALEAEQAMMSQLWEIAIPKFAELTVWDPENPRWPKQLARARQQQRLTDLYSEARLALGKADYALAVAALHEIVTVDASYQDAQQLLKKAEKYAERQRRVASSRLFRPSMLVGVGIFSILLVAAALVVILLSRGLGQPTPTVNANVSATASVSGLPSQTTAAATTTAALTTAAATTQAPLVSPSPASPTSTPLPPTPTPLPLGPSAVSSVAYSPDGKFIAAGLSDGTIRLVSGTNKLPALKGHSDEVNTIAFSRDSKFLASGSRDSTIIVWEPTTGNRIDTYPVTSGSVSTLAFSPDDSTLLFGSGDNTVRLLDRATKRVIASFGGHTGAINSVAFSPDGKLAVSGSSDSTVRIWDVAKGTELFKLTGHNKAVKAVDFSPDGKLVASGAFDNLINLWDVATGKQVGTLQGHTGSVNAVAFSPDGKTLASGSADKTVKRWDVASKTLLNTFPGHSQPVNSLCFEPDGKALISGSADGRIITWNWQGIGTDLNIFTAPAPANAVVFSGNGKAIFYGLANGELALRELNGSPEIPFDARANAIRALAISPDGKMLASGDNSKVLLWNVPDNYILNSPYQLQEGSGNVSALAFSPDGKSVAANVNNSILIWDVNTHRVIHALNGHNGIVRSLAFSPDGKTLASGSEDKTIKIWDLNTNAEIATLAGHTNSVLSVAFSPDGGLLASGSNDNTIIIWDVGKRAALTTLKGDSQAVNSVKFSPDGRMLVSASADNAIRLWDMATLVELATLSNNTAGVNAVTFSPDGSILASASVDKTVRLWKLNPYLVNTITFAE